MRLQCFFFVSVGMLFDPALLIEEPLHVLGVVAIIVVGKSIAALLRVLLFRYPLNTALIVAASLGQIGEFLFILAGMGLSLDLLSVEGFSLVLAGALVPIAFNPIAFATIAPVSKWFLQHSRLARKLATRDDSYAELPMSTERRYLERQVVLIGCGRVGKRIAGALGEQNIPYVAVDQNRELVQDLHDRNLVAVSGDAAIRLY